MNGDPVQVTLVVSFVLLLELGLQAHFKTARFKFLPMYVKLTKLIKSLLREVKAAWIGAGGCEEREQSRDY